MGYKYDMKPYLEHIEKGIQEGPYRADWDSLSDFEVPSWFKRAKFGIFMHWGLYSVAARFNEWYSRNMYKSDMDAFKDHIERHGTQDVFGYKDFIPLFKAEKFDADSWVELFKEAGARYIVPVSEHHDGFQMYKSSLSHWNAYEMGPKRDILGELKAAAEKGGLRFATSNHRAEHWWFMGHGREIKSDIKEPMERGDFYWPAQPEPDNQDLYSTPYPTQEYLDDWLIRVVEIIDNYQPSFLYFDWWLQHDAFKENMKKLAAYYYNQGVKWGKPVAICYKHDGMAFGTGIVEIERGAFADIKAFPWQTDTAIAHNSWCYTDSLDYKNARMIVELLIDVVSKNGNLLLNVGPKADGTIPEKDQEILRDIGRWLRVNGEAIYDAKVWRKCKEGPAQDVEGQFSDGKPKNYGPKDFRFTAGHGCIYAHAMNYPEDGNVCIESLRLSPDQNIPEFHGIIEDVKILGFDEKIDYKVTTKGLEFATKTVKSDMPVVIKIKTK